MIKYIKLGIWRGRMNRAAYCAEKRDSKEVDQMRLEVAAISDRGRIRSGNEDNLILNGEILPEVHNETARLGRTLSAAGCAFFGVFDGMGGYDMGETASFLSATAARDLWQENGRREKPEAFLRRICERANEAVCGEMTRRNSSRIGSTAALLLTGGANYHLCNVGDSPIFLLRRGELRELSQEHTERKIYEAVTGTKCDPKKKFKLTQHIGMFPDDLVMEPYYCDGRMRANDVFLLCSDGLTDMLDRETIAEILQTPDAQAAAEQLVEGALNAGGRDNITVIVIRCKGGGFFSQMGKKASGREK